MENNALFSEKNVRIWDQSQTVEIAKLCWALLRRQITFCLTHISKYKCFLLDRGQPAIMPLLPPVEDLSESESQQHLILSIFDHKWVTCGKLGCLAFAPCHAPPSSEIMAPAVKDKEPKEAWQRCSAISYKIKAFKAKWMQDTNIYTSDTCKFIHPNVIHLHTVRLWNFPSSGSSTSAVRFRNASRLVSRWWSPRNST